MNRIHLVLSDIRSAYNVGSMLRTADAAGVEKVYLCGITPTPIDRFGRRRPDIAKVALGAENFVAWEGCEDVCKTIEGLKKNGFTVVGVEQDSHSEPYYTFTSDSAVAFVVGEETQGLTKEVLSLCDSIVEIPMRGEKESLNVSVALGIVLFGFIYKPS